MDMKQTPCQYYTSSAAHFASCIKKFRQRGRLFVAGEIVSFALFVAFVAVYAMTGLGVSALVLAFASLVGYLLTRHADELNDERVARMEAQRTVCERELAGLRGDYSAFDDGARYVDADHPFTFDMDVFGRQSLYQRICRSVTTGGADQLAAWLRNPDTAHIGEHADAVEFFAAEADWRRDFIAHGVGSRIDTGAVAQALHRVRDVSVPVWVGSRVAAWVAVLLLAGFFVAVGLAAFSSLPSSVPVLYGLVLLALCLGLCHGRLMLVSRAVGNLHSQTAAYVALVRHVCRLGVRLDASAKDVPRLRGFVGSVAESLPSFGEIGRILKSLDRRGNILGLILADVFFLSDYFLLRRFAKWQSQYVGKMDEWIAAVSNIDALVSMATMRYNEPRAVRADVVDGGGSVVFEARGLAHPFIGAKAVGNDFSIADDNYYIITGANMAGKSTFLRSLGINWLLAMCGMPVFAESLRLSVFPLFTSMRTSDDLSRGISYFNAELRRLKLLIDYQAQHPGTLIILDEILKGTNSADKLNGSRMFLEYMSHRHATCVVATHDLELSRMAETRPGRFHNYCFEIGLGTSVTYTYRITEGVARNQNATFLLKQLLKS